MAGAGLVRGCGCWGRLMNCWGVSGSDTDTNWGGPCCCLGLCWGGPGPVDTRENCPDEGEGPVWGWGEKSWDTSTLRPKDSRSS